MHATLVLATLAALVGGIVATPEISSQQCDCGYVGASCNDTGFVDGFGNTRLVPVDEFPGIVCPAVESFGCFVSDGKAVCACSWGWKGDLCDEPIEAKLGVLIVAGLVMPISGILISVYLFRNHIKSVGWDADFKINGIECVSGRASVKFMFFYRLVVVLLSVAFIVQQMANAYKERSVSFKYRFFTVYNFHLLVVYFAIGTYLAGSVLFGGRKTTRPLTTIERVFQVLLEVLLSMAVLISVVIWAIMFPIGLQTGRAAEFLNLNSYVQHGGNTVLLLTDYMLIGLNMKLEHVHFAVTWGCLYCLFHGVLMLVEYGKGLPHTASYDFLSASDPLQPVYVTLLAILIWVVYYAVAKLDRFAVHANIKDDAITEWASHPGDKASIRRKAGPTFMDFPEDESHQL